MKAVEKATLDRERRTRIERPWPRWRWGTKGEDRWTGFDERLYATVIAGACVLVAGFVEIPWLTRHQTPPPQFGGVGRNLFALLPLALLNAIVLDRMISARIPRQREVVLWLRGLRFLVLGIPVLGLAGIPLWRKVVIARPGWASHPHSCGAPKVDLGSPAARTSRLRLRLDAYLWVAAQRFPALVAWVVICQVLPWCTFANWLAAIAPSRPLLTIVILTALHLVATACVWIYAKVEILKRQVSGCRAAWFRVSPLFFLAPAPLMFAGAIAWIPLGTTTRDEGSHAESLYSLRARQAKGQGSPSGDRDPAPGRHEVAFRRTVLGHSILGLAVGAWIGAFLGSRGFEFGTRGATYLFLGVLSSFAMAAVLGLLRPLDGFVRTFPRFAEHLRPPFLFTLAVAPGTLLFGSYEGWLFARHDWTAAGSALQVLGLSASTLLFTAMLGMFSRDLFRARSAIGPGLVILFMIAGVALALLGALIEGGRYEHAQTVAISVTRGLAMAALFAHFALGLAALGPLLYPFRFANLFDHRLPRSLRARLGGLVATALVPLGGLPAPWWIWNRRRNGRSDAWIWLKRVGRRRESASG